MPETIDYKVNLDIQEALQNLQVVDMQANQAFRSTSGGFSGGGGGGAFPSFAGFTHSQQAFGDLSFSAGQFAQRAAAPFQQIQSSMPSYISFGTAATAMVAPGALMMPHGVAAGAFQAMAKEQFATQVGRGVAGAAAGLTQFTAGAVAGSVAGGGIGMAAGALGLGKLAAGALGLGGALVAWEVGSMAMEPVIRQMEGQSLLEDVVGATSRRFIGPDISSSPSGRGFTRGANQRIARTLRHSANRDPMLDTNDIANIAGTGAQMGFFKGVEDSSGYLERFRKLTSDVKKVSAALGTSLAEGMQTMGQLKGMGFGVGQIGGVVDRIHGMAGGDPSTMRGIIATGGMGAGMFAGTGMSTTGGFWQAIQVSGMAQQAKGVVGAQAMQHAGGQRAVTQMLLGSNVSFQQGGMGMMMQAGLQAGGAGMGGSMMDILNAGGGAIGGMGMDQMADFMMTRMEQTGNMTGSQRMAMQRKQFEFIAESTGMSVRSAAFFGLRGQFGDVRARVMSSAIAGGGGGGGGGGGAGRGRRAERALLEKERTAYMAANSPSAALGRFRDSIAQWAEPRADFFMGIGASMSEGVAEHGILGFGGALNSSVAGGANLDLAMSARSGRLFDAMTSMDDLSVAHYAWSGGMAKQLEAMGATKANVGTEGVIDFGDGVGFTAESVGKVVRSAEDAADTAFNSRKYKAIQKTDDFAKTMARLDRTVFGNEDQRDKVADMLSHGRIGAAARATGLSMTSSRDVAALRQMSEGLGVEITRGQVGGGEIAQAGALAVEWGSKQDRFQAMQELGLGGAAGARGARGEERVGFLKRGLNWLGVTDQLDQFGVSSLAGGIALGTTALINAPAAATFGAVAATALIIDKTIGWNEDRVLRDDEDYFNQYESVFVQYSKAVLANELPADISIINGKVAKTFAPKTTTASGLVIPADIPIIGGEVDMSKAALGGEDLDQVRGRLVRESGAAGSEQTRLIADLKKIDAESGEKFVAAARDVAADVDKAQKSGVSKKVAVIASTGVDANQREFAAALQQITRANRVIAEKIEAMES